MPTLLVSALALAAFAFAAGLASAMRGRALAVVYPVCALAAVALCLVDLDVLLRGGDVAASLALGLPTIGFRIRLDALSAFFGIVINGGVLAASV